MTHRGAARRFTAAVLLAAAAFGCGAQSDGAPSDPTPLDPSASRGGDANDPAGAAGAAGGSGQSMVTGNPDPTDPSSLFNVCPSPIGEPSDLAATPRADANLEFLALVVEPDRAVASQANYDRVVADVAAIRALVPELASIEFRPFHDGRDVRVSFNEAGMEALNQNAFAGWFCLNEALGARVGSVVDVFPTYAPLVTLRGVHNMPHVKWLYEQLPGIGIGGAEITEGRSPGPTWCVARDGSEYEYVLDWARGSCSTGCREHDAHHFSTRAAGEVTPLEVWRSAEDELPPDWFTRLCP